MLKKIIVPTDFSACANNAIDYAVQSAKILPVEVIVLHSFDVRGDLYTDYMGVNKEFNLYEYENMISKRYNEKNLSAMHLTGEDFKQSLSDYIEDNDIDILAMIKYEGDFGKTCFTGARPNQ
jgi:nucleotide-binding universal stress UspA family protein